MKKFVLIVAGGSGSRMNSVVPKQFMLISGKPVLMHTIRRFYDYDPESEIIVVLPKEQIQTWNKLCDDYRFRIKHAVAEGGSVRFESVRNGLSVIEGEGLVAIHDGVRPLVSRETINRCFETAEMKGNAVPVMPANESLRRIEGDCNKAVDRTEYVSVQTPEVFRISEIKEAYKSDYNDTFTDDASVLEHAGFKINLVEGNKENIKITHPVDIIIAETLIKDI
jgi:2-C-methyl-D-erythritol 4-phosphate cytidylyltransferase